jgi:para-aminobenzoate synthetase
MSTLLVDNYDSYTYNVFHLLASVSGEEPIVIHNDMVSWRALERFDFDAIVLSPGPGRPDRWHDFGVCADILRFSEVPVLGVCLGHQGLGHVLKAQVETAPMAMHGRLSKVEHADEGLFAGLPQGFSVVRYHSLAVTGSMEGEGKVCAWTADGVVMGIEHSRRPMWGVQFHPESIATEHGHKLIENFYALAAERVRPRKGSLSVPLVPPRRCRKRLIEPRVGLRLRTIEGEPPAVAVFERLFGEERHAFWLDSAEAPTSLGRCSFMGSTLGPNRMVLEYDVHDGIVTRHDAHGTSTEHGTIFDVLSREIEDNALGGLAQGEGSGAPGAAPGPAGAGPSLVGGFVGYLGYECKAACGSANVHRSDVPDAVMMLANRLVAVDHVGQRTHLIAVCRGDEPEAEQWLEQGQAILEQAIVEQQILEQALAADPLPSAGNGTSDGRENGGSGPAGAAHEERAGAGEPDGHVTFRVGRGREQYLADIARCQAALAAGESYEVCLTDQIHTDASPDPWRLYKLLRARNPAPFAAYLKLGEVSVLSSSPERFLSVDRDRRVQARPIKGTAPRSPDPARDDELRQGLLEDEKTFAEHLMIVDLLRNDLGRVCEVDSVRVPDFMVVERYATVHQLISNVTGVLEPERSGVDCVRACFPGGSMTGAPKLRTMEIIDDIEREARGVYSGALGYFGLDGSVDLSIVIRTIVLRPGATTIGAGGAIVIQSDAQDEFDELLLKARAPMSTIALAVTGGDGAERAWSVELEPSREHAEASVR